MHWGGVAWKPGQSKACRSLINNTICQWYYCNRNQLSFAVSTYWTIQWVLSEASAVLFASVSCDDCVNMTCYNHTTNMQAHSVCCTTRTLLVIAICLTLPEQLFDCYIFFYLIQAQTHTGKQNSEIC